MRNLLDILFDIPVSRLFLEDLLGRQIMGVTNFPPKQIGAFVSEFFVTGFVLEDGNVILAEPERAVPNGTKLA
jgi:tRNA-binding protein